MPLQSEERAATHLFKWLSARVAVPEQDAYKDRRAGIPPFKVPRLRETNQLQKALDLVRYPVKNITLQDLKIAYERTLFNVSQGREDETWDVSARIGNLLGIDLDLAHYLFGKNRGPCRQQAAQMAVNVAQFAYFRLGLKMEHGKGFAVAKFGKKPYFGVAEGKVVSTHCSLPTDIEIGKKLEPPRGGVDIRSPELLPVYNGALVAGDEVALYAAQGLAWLLQISKKDLLVGLHPYTLDRVKVGRPKFHRPLGPQVYEQGVWLLINAENPVKALYLLLCPDVIGSKEFIKRFSNPFTNSVIRPQTRIILRDRLDRMYLDVGKADL